MSKKDWIWVAIRGFGLYLVVNGISHFAKTIAYGAIVFFHYVVGLNAQAVLEMVDVDLSIYEVYLSRMMKSGLICLVLLLFGWYFLRGGGVVKRIIHKGLDNNEDPEGNGENEDAITSRSEAEEETFST